MNSKKSLWGIGGRLAAIAAAAALVVSGTGVAFAADDGAEASESVAAAAEETKDAADEATTEVASDDVADTTEAPAATVEKAASEPEPAAEEVPAPATTTAPAVEKKAAKANSPPETTSSSSASPSPSGSSSPTVEAPTFSVTPNIEGSDVCQVNAAWKNTTPDRGWLTAVPSHDLEFPTISEDTYQGDTATVAIQGYSGWTILIWGQTTSGAKKTTTVVLNDTNCPKAPVTTPDPSGTLLATSEKCEAITADFTNIIPEGAEVEIHGDWTDEALEPGTYSVPAGTHTVTLTVNGVEVDSKTVTVKPCYDGTGHHGYDLAKFCVPSDLEGKTVKYVANYKDAEGFYSAASDPVQVTLIVDGSSRWATIVHGVLEFPAPASAEVKVTGIKAASKKFEGALIHADWSGSDLASAPCQEDPEPEPVEPATNLVTAIGTCDKFTNTIADGVVNATFTNVADDGSAPFVGGEAVIIDELGNQWGSDALPDVADGESVDFAFTGLEGGLTYTVRVYDAEGNLAAEDTAQVSFCDVIIPAEWDQPLCKERKVLSWTGQWIWAWVWEIGDFDDGTFVPNDDSPTSRPMTDAEAAEFCGTDPVDPEPEKPTKPEKPERPVTPPAEPGKDQPSTHKVPSQVPADGGGMLLPIGIGTALAILGLYLMTVRRPGAHRR